MSIKPCGWCGANGARFLVIGYGFELGFKDSRYVKCLNCGQEGPMSEGKQAAIDAWNEKFEWIAPGFTVADNSMIDELVLSDYENQQDANEHTRKGRYDT